MISPDIDWSMVPATGSPPRVLSHRHKPSIRCDFRGHEWQVLPHPRAVVYDPRSGAFQHFTYEVVCLVCELMAHVDHVPPAHSDGCLDWNVLDPFGRFKMVKGCSCQQRTHG